MPEITTRTLDDGRRYDDYDGVFWETTVYSDGGAGRFEAIIVPWSAVESILGHPHTATVQDDADLVAHLLAKGADDWVKDAPGFIDEHNWGLIGPEIPD